MQVDPIKPTVKAPGIKLLKLKYDTPLSNFAFNFNWRRYTKGFAIAAPPRPYPRRVLETFEKFPREAGQCRLPVSKPELKERLVSALETDT